MFWNDNFFEHFGLFSTSDSDRDRDTILGFKFGDFYFGFSLRDDCCRNCVYDGETVNYSWLIFSLVLFVIVFVFNFWHH